MLSCDTIKFALCCGLTEYIKRDRRRKGRLVKKLVQGFRAEMLRAWPERVNGSWDKEENN